MSEKHSPSDPIIRELVYARCEGKCGICKRSHAATRKIFTRFPSTTFDAWGVGRINDIGEYTLDNFQVVCWQCKDKKRGKKNE